MLTLQSLAFTQAHRPLIGAIHKVQSDLVMESTWYTDICYRRAFIYDYYHDEQPTDYINLSEYGEPVDIKFYAANNKGEDKDPQGFRIQFLPSHNCNLDYYQEYVEKWGSEYPIGLYISIPDERGILRKWLITDQSNALGVQFPTWYVLPVDYVFRWIANGQRYELCGVSRNPSSGKGVAIDSVTTNVENQKKCILPMNDISKTIFYDTRLAISAFIDEPIVWRCTKVDQTSPMGINKITFIQDSWNYERDAVNPVLEGEPLYGIWCDYYTEYGLPSVIEQNIPQTMIYGEITITGTQEIKVGGSYKKLSVSYFNGSTPIELPEGEWVVFDNSDADITASLIFSTASIDSNQIKFKINGLDYLIGKCITVMYRPNDTELSSATLSIPVVAL